jgi:tetratricopeptide (TPR) repeat protein
VLVAGSLLLLAGALSKEQALLLPLVLFVWSWFLAQKKETWWKDNRAWLAGYAAAIAVALLLRSNAGVGFGPSDAERPFSFLSMGPRAFLLYMKLWFAPWPLNNYYMPVDLAPDWVTALGVLATAGLVVLAIRQGRRGEAIASCVFALIFLLPVLHIRPFNGAVAAARFFYLSSAGLALLTTFALSGLQKMKTARMAASAIVGAAIVAGLILSTNGTKSWANETTFYTHMVQTSPRSAISHHGMAEVLMKAGKLPEAAEQCRQAIQLDATFADGHELLGVIAAKQRDFETARQEFEAVKSLRPEKASAYKNLGLIAMQQNNAAAAIENFRQALALEPRAADIHYYLGTVLAATGDLDGAAREAQILDSLDPARAQALRKRLSDAAPAPRQP